MQVAAVVKSPSPGQKLDARVATWQSEVTRRTRRPLLFLLGASVLLLAVASVSVSGLFAIEVRSDSVNLRHASPSAPDGNTSCAHSARRPCSSLQRQSLSVRGSLSCHWHRCAR